VVSARIGLLIGRESSFPQALVREVRRRDPKANIDLARIEAPRADRAPPYDLLIDRISHEIPSYQPWLKLAALHGTRVINDPFWRTVDDKFFDAGLASRLGVAVPRTALLPNKEHGPDVTEGSLRNLEWVDWDALIAELGLPLFLKPHWGGGWRDVIRVSSRDELLAAYDRSGTRTLIVQEGIAWTQYVRCIVIGRTEVRPAAWDPRLPHHERYRRAAETMPPLDPGLSARVEKDARLLCHALGYDMNTVEFAVRDRVPYAIDFMNSAPDLDISSLGEDHFRWAVDRMAELAVRLASDPSTAVARTWEPWLPQGSGR
jgi:hypothetical protein